MNNRPGDTRTPAQKFLPFFGGAGVGIAAFLFFEAMLPFDAKPSVMLGRAIGTFQTHDIADKQEALERYRHAFADLLEVLR